MSPEEMMLFSRMRDEEPGPAGYDKMLRYARQQRKPIEPMAFTGSSGFPEPIVRGAEKTARGIAANIESYIQGQRLADPSGIQAMLQDKLRQKQDQAAGDTEYARLMGGGELAPVPEPRKPHEISQGPFAEEQSLKTVPGMLSSFVSPENLIPLGGRAIGAVRQAAKDLGRGVTRMGGRIADRVMVPSPGDAGVLKGGAAAAGGAGALGYSEDSEAIIPASRRAMLAANARLLERLREGPQALTPSKKELHPSLAPEAARATAQQAQREINIGQRLNGPPLAPPDLTGYTMFDYSKLGETAAGKEQSSLIRPGPAQNKFERLPDWMRDVVADPYVYRNVEKAIKRGEPFKHWYDIGGYRGALQNEGMSEEDFKRYMLYQAAAAQNVGPKKQVQIGNYLWHADQNGLLVPGAEMSFPKGYGSKAQEQIWENALGIKAGGIIDSQKLGSYGESYMGNLNPWTGDTHATRLTSMLSHDPRLVRQSLRQEKNPEVVELLNSQGIPFREAQTVSKKTGETHDFVSWSPRESLAQGKFNMREALDRPALWYDTPTGSSYGALEQYLWMPIAQKTGMRTGEGQASAWVGAGGLTGLQAEPKLAQQIFEDSVRDLMLRHGMSQAQAIRAVRKGEKY